MAEQIIDFLSEQPDTLKAVLTQQDSKGCSCQSILGLDPQYGVITGKIKIYCILVRDVIIGLNRSTDLVVKIKINLGNDCVMIIDA